MKTKIEKLTIETFFEVNEENKIVRLNNVVSNDKLENVHLLISGTNTTENALKIFLNGSITEGERKDFELLLEQIAKVKHHIQDVGVTRALGFTKAKKIK